MLGRKSSINELLTNPPVLEGKKIKLRPKRFSDVFNDYLWRRDSELCYLDATYPITSSFEEFVRLYTQAQNDCQHALRFAIEALDGKHIGNFGYFNIDEKKNEAEMGIMIGDKKYWDQNYGVDVIDTAITHIFGNTDIKRIHLKTLDWNIRAQKCFSKCGFVTCGKLRRGEFSFTLMDMLRSSINKPFLKNSLTT